MSRTASALPAEWARQDAILLTWPHADSDWRPWLSQADRTLAALAAAISHRETVLIGCHDLKHSQHIRDLLRAADADLSRCRLYAVPSNDIWARDHGPITVHRDGQPVLLDFRFNGWGEKYAFELDDRITARLHESGAFGPTPREPVDLILEGGSIETDGRHAADHRRMPAQSQPQRLGPSGPGAAARRNAGFHPLSVAATGTLGRG